MTIFLASGKDRSDFCQMYTCSSFKMRHYRSIILFEKAQLQ